MEQHEIEKLNVVYANEFNNIVLSDLNAKTLDILMVALTHLRQRGTDLVEIPLADIRKSANIKSYTNEQFVNIVVSLCEYIDEKTTIKKRPDQLNYGLYHIFTAFEINWEKQTLAVAISPLFVKWFNNLTKGFTFFELAEFTGIKSKYAKNLYRLLQQYKSTGSLTYEIDDLREKMGVPKTYTIKNFIHKRLNPALEELNEYFTGLNVEYIKAKKAGSPIEKIRFSFDTITKPLPADISAYIHEKREREVTGRAYESAPAARNKFNNFESRDYDMDLLERELYKAQNNRRE